jgi:hypothetical protein
MTSRYSQDSVHATLLALLRALAVATTIATVGLLALFAVLLAGIALLRAWKALP